MTGLLEPMTSVVNCSLEDTSNILSLTAEPVRNLEQATGTTLSRLLNTAMLVGGSQVTIARGAHDQYNFWQ